MKIIVFASACFILGVLIGFSWGAEAESQFKKIEAVRVGAAFWQPNPDGSTTFVWKTP